MRAAMPKFSLSYFPVRARAECIRMCVPLSHKCRVVQHSTTGLLAPLTLVASLTSIQRPAHGPVTVRASLRVLPRPADFALLLGRMAAYGGLEYTNELVDPATWKGAESSATTL